MSGPFVIDQASTHGRVTSEPLIAESVGASLWCVILIATLGFRIVRHQIGEYSPVGRVARALLPFGAILAAASFWPQAGRNAGVLAAGWLLVCDLAAIDGVWRLLHGGYRSAESVCSSASFLYLAVGSSWLVLSRLGIAPFHLPAIRRFAGSTGATTIFRIAAVSLLIGMTLVAAYAVGEFTGSYWLVIPQMTRFHGPANALGFALCGLLGWTLAYERGSASRGEPRRLTAS
jgi:hypothetical protein